MMGWVLTMTQSAFAETVWHETKGNHFIVYEREESSFSGEVLRSAENIYQTVTRYFGSLPASGFWTWDNRCKIYLYPTRDAYVFGTRQPAWSSGYANIAHRAIVSYAGAPSFFESVLPHEIGHLIFREFIQLKNKGVPRWLDEGFAISQEKSIRTTLDEVIRKAVKEDVAIPVSDLNRVGSWQNLPAERAQLFYAEAQSLTRFLLERYDSSRFVNFCRLLRDQASLEDALRRSYYQDFQTLEDFERKWKRYVLSQ